jgi:phospholipid/cholesterol/gamma-HCH transport system substrate-binding protein
MVSRRTEIEVGLAVLGALAILIWGISWLKDYRFTSRTRIWHVRFAEAGGLAESDEVLVNGMRRGVVKRMTLADDQVAVDLALSPEIRLTRDSRVAIRSIGLMGERVIAVDYRSTGEPYAPGDTIPGVYEKGLAEVMAEVGSATESVARITAHLRALADAVEKSGDVAGTLRNFHATSEALRLAVQENRAGLTRMVADFSATARTARALTADREAQLWQALEHFAQAAENLSRLAVRLDSLRASLQTVAARIETGQGTLGKLVNDERLYADLNASIQSVRALIEDIKANPRKYFKVEIF